MAIERYWKAIDPVSFISDGTSNGIVTVLDTTCFKVKMVVILKADTLSLQRYEIKRVLSDTQLILGPEKESIHKRSDISAYTVALNSTIEAPEQERPRIPPADYERAVYEEEPTVAKRVFPVDKYGNNYTEDNPFPVRLPPGSIEAEANIELPNKEDIKILNIPAKATEVSFLFPNGLQFYKIQVRDDKDVIRIGLNSGDIATGKYWEVGFGEEFSPTSHKDYEDGYRLYFESKHKNNVDLEIFYWFFG